MGELAIAGGKAVADVLGLELVRSGQMHAGDGETDVSRSHVDPHAKVSASLVPQAYGWSHRQPREDNAPSAFAGEDVLMGAR
jgi:hypothetical protein